MKAQAKGKDQTPEKKEKKQTDLGLVDKICKVLIVIICAYGYIFFRDSMKIHNQIK
jgi:hypothetical protein